MQSVKNPEEMVNNSAESVPTSEAPVAELLASIAGDLRSLGSRLELIERRLGQLEPGLERVVSGDGSGEDDALTGPSSERFASPYALLCDGRLLLSVRDLEGIDLSDRETFTGVVLDEAESSDALDRMGPMFEEAAAFSAGWLLKKAKRRGGA